MTKHRKKASSGWPGGPQIAHRGLTPASAHSVAVVTAVSLAWMGTVFLGLLGLAEDDTALRFAGGAAVGLPPMLATGALRRRIARLDEMQAASESRAVLMGALFAVSFGAAFYALRSLQGDTPHAELLAMLPPMAFFFGAFMLIVERQALSDEPGARQ